LRRAQTVEDYFEANECSYEEGFLITTQNSKVTPIIGLNTLGGRELLKVNPKSRPGVNLSHTWM